MDGLRSAHRRNDEAAPHLLARPSCPVCERPARVPFRSRNEIAAQLEARDRFFARRVSRDVTNLVLGTPAAILRCSRCGVLVRDGAPAERAYRDDSYRDDELESLHAIHAQAFRQKDADYRARLPRGARVVEVGCYAGGFLAAAAEWGWSAIGTDIGHDPVRFCRERGFDARRVHLHECSLDRDSLDGVFVWNCFEQMGDPAALLGEAHRVLRAAGLLVIRIPDAAFYMRCEQNRDGHAFAALAYNGLLGWPHRFGYDAATLRRLVESHRFAFIHALRRAVIGPLRTEKTAIPGDVDPGWIELTFRKR